MSSFRSEGLAGAREAGEGARAGGSPAAAEELEAEDENRAGERDDDAEETTTTIELDDNEELEEEELEEASTAFSISESILSSTRPLAFRALPKALNLPRL